ncbi:tetraacyldisaccharide 4'-kinase [Microvirga lotononidis]|uniref:Tetraacyldisaccharide 4'-kinase n=1 Tax=Microvirga lotononidis TaxID=864069 RepID=I4YV23_9HYPH|nr:tetraacyldisaccharide 4'-kinase [Microvirga lotononidis]EIM27815.1 tetraacyldisaccharide 4''-kinase [Microvirga lotononidis]WQO28055.1 tetraacyldisaccharide 4'-kinase [Microvirga lotononidis]
MRAPRFWWQPFPTLPATLLRPAGIIYTSVATRRMHRTGEKADLPVICIGNFTAGGAGKTPTALAVARILDAGGESPAFLSRGYGGRLPGPVQVSTPDHSASDVGDEPILLSRTATTIVSRDRPAGAQLAYESGATVVIMDDGLQNPSLVKDCAIAVVDGATGIGNGLPLPAGPLRAPMDVQWPMIDAVLIIGDGEPGRQIAEEAERRDKRVFEARLAPSPEAIQSLEGRRVLAFAGIGRPGKFFDTLRDCGAIVEAARSFPDHHRYTTAELGTLQREAEARGLVAVTTEKDFARIAAIRDPRPWPELTVLPVRLRIENEAGLRNLLLRRINERRLRVA